MSGRVWLIVGVSDQPTDQPVSDQSELVPVQLNISSWPMGVSVWQQGLGTRVWLVVGVSVW